MAEKQGITWLEFVKRYIVVRLPDTGLYAIQIDGVIAEGRYPTNGVASDAAINQAFARHGTIIVPDHDRDYEPYS